MDKALSEKENIGFLPTPIHKMKNLSKKYGYNLWVKRDDQTGLALGGNKTRKLEYIMYDAVKQKADCIITAGATQSNHVRQSVAAANLYNMEAHVVLFNLNMEPTDSGNFRLDKMMNAKIYVVNDNEAKEKKMQEIYDKLKSEKRSPYMFPVGGSNVIGTMGYVNMYKELLEDEKRLGFKFDYIFFASSSYGTPLWFINR